MTVKDPLLPVILLGRINQFTSFHGLLPACDPSQTLNDLLSQSDSSCNMNSWCLWFGAELNKTAVHVLLFDIRGTQSPPTLPYRCLTLFACFLLLKIQKVFLILTAVIRTAVNYCFHCKSIGSCHGDMTLKGWDFLWGESFQGDIATCLWSLCAFSFDYFNLVTVCM